MILFILDGGQEKGYGHLVRGGILAKECNEKGIDVAFLCTNNESEKYLSSTQNFAPLYIIESDKVLQYALSLAPNVLISDCKAPLSFEDISALHQQGIFVIEFDRDNRESWADEVINGFEPVLYGAHGRPFRLVGKKYFILRHEFTNAKNVKSQRSWIINPALFICFGGSDPANLIEPVLNILAELTEYHEMEVHVVTGFGTDRTKNITEKYSVLKHIHVYSNVGPKALANLMQTCHLAIISFGNLLVEALFLELPVFMINPTRAHEDYTERILKTDFTGIGKTFGYSPHINWKHFSDELLSLSGNIKKLELMSNATKGVIDGRGLCRVVEYINCIKNVH